MEYISKACTHQIKSDSTGLYFSLLLHAITSCIFMGLLRVFVWQVNRQDAILHRQQLYVGEDSVRKDVNYQTSLIRFTLAFGVCVMLFAALYNIEFATVLHYRRTAAGGGNLVSARPSFCNGTRINPYPTGIDVEHFRCNFVSEMLIFYFDTITLILELVFDVAILAFIPCVWIYYFDVKSRPYFHEFAHVDHQMTAAFKAPLAPPRTLDADAPARGADVAGEFVDIGTYLRPSTYSINSAPG